MGNYKSKGFTYPSSKLQFTLQKSMLYLKLERNRKVERLQREESKMLNELQYGQYPLNKSRAIASVNVKLINYATAANITIQHLKILMEHSILLELGQEHPERANDLVPSINTVIWATYKLNLNVLEEVVAMVQRVLGTLYVKHALEGLMVERRLKDQFENLLPTPFEIYSYMVDFAARSTHSPEERGKYIFNKDDLLRRMGVDPFAAPPPQAPAGGHGGFGNEAFKDLPHQKVFESGWNTPVAEQEELPKTEPIIEPRIEQEMQVRKSVFRESGGLEAKQQDQLRQSLVVNNLSNIAQSIFKVDDKLKESIADKYVILKEDTTADPDTKDLPTEEYKPPADIFTPEIIEKSKAKVTEFDDFFANLDNIKAQSIVPNNQSVLPKLQSFAKTPADGFGQAQFQSLPKLQPEATDLSNVKLSFGYITDEMYDPREHLTITKSILFLYLR